MNLISKIKAVLLMLLSSFIFSFMQVAVHISGKNIPALEQIFFRNLVGIAFCFIITKNRRFILGKREHQKLLFGWSGFAVFGIFFGFLSVRIGEQAGVSIISHLSPFLVVILAHLILKEHIQRVQILSICIAFLGSLLVTTPSAGYDPTSLLLSLISAICNAVAYIFVGLLKGKEAPIVLSAHYSLLGLLTSIPFMASNFVVPSPVDLVLLILIGLSGMLGILFQNMAYALAPVSEMSIYSYSGIIFSMFLGAVVLGEELRLLPILGGLIIIAAAVLVYVATGVSRAKTGEGQKEKSHEEVCS